MAAPFKCDEKVTIEKLVVELDPVYGTETKAWVPFLVRYWANVQDVLPSRAETTKNGLGKSVQRARLRMQGAKTVTADMRAVLHNRSDRVMQIIAGPAQLDDRVHTEFQLEGYSNG